MCGITGIFSWGQSVSNEFITSAVRKQTNKLAHRGPDAEGFFFADGIGLGHRRLSIIDLSDSSNQPFTEKTERFTIVFNGEIYNYQQIKSELTSYPWKTSSDTEVILAAYIKWGPTCLHKLNGMFAFAIWDSLKQELFIARDRLGVKPLYYFKNQFSFSFSSELRSLTAGINSSPLIKTSSVVDFLKYQSIRTPHTFFENVWQLPPGHWGIISRDSFKIQEYWAIVRPSEHSIQNLSYADTL